MNPWIFSGYDRLLLLKKEKERRLKSFLKALPTPIRYLPEYDCYIKDEWTLPSGSHKDRETTALLTGEQKDCLCVTTGNAGISLAYYYGKKAHIVVPLTCPPAKIRKLEEYGAHVIKVGKDYEAAWLNGRIIAKQMRWRNISPGVEPLRHIGDMEITSELSDEGHDPDLEGPLMVFVPAANHTLAYGILRGFRGRAKVVSCVLPNHPFLEWQRIKLTEEDLRGYSSISTASQYRPYLETKYRGSIATVETDELRRIREENENKELDLAVYLALEISRRYEGIKIVIGTGARR